MTFWRSYAHLVWATKNREPLIVPEIEAPLYACIVSTAAEWGCYVHAVNGISDHVHVIISIPPKHSVAWVVKNIKGSSSHFVNHALHDYSEPITGQSFAWQRGYGYLSLGESQLSRAVAYVQNQKQHHQAQTTNGWLERIDENENDHHQPPSAAVREPQAIYDLSDDLPF
jgi:putative transposase